MNFKATPLPVQRCLKKLGHDLRDARRRRRIPMYIAAQRAGVSLSTLSKIERGNGGVALRAYANLFFVYGMIDRLAELADPSRDKVGLMLESEMLPERIRIPKREKQED